MPVSPSDEHLLRAVVAGDQIAFIELYERWRGPMFRFARQMCGDARAAEDVTQDVFVAVLEQASQFDPERGPVAAYLYGIARHQVQRRLRADRRYERIDDRDDAAPQVVDEAGGDVGDGIERASAMALLQQLVRTLPAPYREALVLCDLHELTYVQASAVLGCPIGTVRSRLHRARLLLARKVQQDARQRGLV